LLRRRRRPWPADRRAGTLPKFSSARGRRKVREKEES